MDRGRSGLVPDRAALLHPAACRDRLKSGEPCAERVDGPAALALARPLGGGSCQRVLDVQARLDALLTGPFEGTAARAPVATSLAVGVPTAQYLQDPRLLVLVPDAAGMTAPPGPLPRLLARALARQSQA